MPHERSRFALATIKDLASFWPVVGIVGPRQVGKTTVLNHQIAYKSYVTLDDDDVRSSARRSAKVFLAQFDTPFAIDEITKAPDLFDAIKSKVDKKRIPGQYIITGSTQFSEKIGIQESLTGRIGIVKMNPLCLAEAKGLRLLSIKDKPTANKARFTIEEVVHHAQKGGMPVPMFIRENSVISDYWRSWLDTTIYRDVARFFKRGFDPEFAFDLIQSIARVILNGELATFSNLKLKNTRRASIYLSAMEGVFLLRRLRCHEVGVGQDAWMFFDSGFAHYMMNFAARNSADATLSLIRHFVFNETSVMIESMKKRDDRVYYKSAKGTPVDFIWDDVPYKIISSTKSIGWEEKAVIGAMKKLGSKVGYLIGPSDFATQPPKTGGVGLLPWATWS